MSHIFGIAVHHYLFPAQHDETGYIFTSKHVDPRFVDVECLQLHFYNNIQVSIIKNLVTKSMAKPACRKSKTINKGKTEMKLSH